MTAFVAALGLALQACHGKGCVIFPDEPDVGHAIRVLGSGGLSIRDLRKDESWKYTLRLGNSHKSLICSRDRSTQDEGVSGKNRCREPSHS